MDRIKGILQANAYGIAIFLLLVIFMMSHPQRTLDVDCLCSFTIDYQTGFGGRKLIASVVSLLFDNLNQGRLLKLVYLISIAGCLLFAYCCNLFINKLKRRSSEAYLSSVYLTALYLACPASLLFLLVFPNFGRLDLFLYMSCLLFCFLFYHRRHNRLAYFLCVALLMVFNILSHHIFVATYMPFFVALFIYDIWFDGFNRKLFVCHAILAVVVIIAFLSVILFSSMTLSLDEATNYRPGVELSRKFVWFIYYAHISDHVQIYVLSNLRKLIVGFFLTLFFLLPLALLGWHVWKATLKGQSRQTKNLFAGMQSAFLLTIPAFCVTVDHARWFAAIVFSQFLLLAYFSFDQRSSFSIAGKMIGLFVKRHLFLAACLIIYCSLLGLFGSDRTFECGEFILDKLRIYKTVVQPPIGI